MAEPRHDVEKKCWVTLVTKPSYLPGVIILAHTIIAKGSRYPLIIQYTETLGEDAIKALKEEEATYNRIVLDPVELLLPRKGQENIAIVAERFKDTFTKLRAFEVHKLGYTTACFLDADIAAFQNPDVIFDIELPSREWLGANHACICNLDNNTWASPDWHKGNCAYTPLTNPDQVAAEIVPGCRPTYRALNGGMFLFYPTEQLWQKMLHFFNISDNLKSYQFPDQDFLSEFFKDQWQPVSWKFNALKTMRYFHPQMWSDDMVVLLHYIVDKPWERPVSSDGIAGHMGRDGETHQWWWNIYQGWLEERKASGDTPTVLDIMMKLVGTQKPFTELIPLPQEAGKPEDVKPYP